MQQKDYDTGVPADLVPRGFGPPRSKSASGSGPPGPNPLADLVPHGGPNLPADLVSPRGFGPLYFRDI